MSEQSYSVQQTTDGGYIIAGYSDSFRGAYLIKTDSLGDSLWTKTYEFRTYAMVVKQTAEGGYIVSGTAGMDVWLLKTDEYGHPKWARTYGEADVIEEGHDVIQTPDCGYIVIGDKGEPNEDIYVIRTDSFGDTLWTRIIDNGGKEEARSIQQTRYGSYIITGTHVLNFVHWFYLAEIEANGDTVWTKQHVIGDGYEVQRTTHGEYIATGNDVHNLFLLKANSHGDTLWTRSYGGSFYQQGNSLQQTTDGGYIVTGFRDTAVQNPCLWLLRTDTNGDTLWTKTYGHDRCCGESVQLTSDGGYIIAGWTYEFGAGEADIWLLKIAPEPFIEETMIKSAKSNSFGVTIISGPLLLPEGRNCRVFDITGRTVLPEKIKPGIYFVEIDNRIMQKVVKVK